MQQQAAVALSQATHSGASNLAVWCACLCCWKRLNKRCKSSSVSKSSTRGTAAAVVQVRIVSTRAQDVQKCDSGAGYVL